jgi:FtsP/CotA-like multicopper oxidase with cupredoxin domain
MSDDKKNDPTERPDALLSRRGLLLAGTAAGAAGALLHGGVAQAAAQAPGRPGRDYQPVTVPNGAKLPWKLVGGVKVFHMVAEEVDHEMAPGLKVLCWGYNGRVHGPVIEAVEGDHVRIYVTNRLPAPTTVHWHGLLLPNGMDGVGGLNQKAILPGETYMYEFVLRQAGTAMYHSHHDEMTQMALGMTGLFVIHPRKPRRRVDRDFAIMLHEWRIDPGAKRPNPNEMTEFNMLTMNAKAFPGTAPLVVRKGQRVRIRLGNLGAMDHHPIHLHGYQFKITETDGGEIAESAQWPETTVLVPVGSTRTVEFVADAPGDWAMHCHMTHHVMNQMGHGLPNVIGVDPGKLDERIRKNVPGYMTMGQTGMGDMAEMGMPVPPNSIPMLGGKGKYDAITMGGMFTILKVRENIKGYGDPGWYDVPSGTLAMVAAEDALRRDGIDPKHAPAVEDDPTSKPEPA